MNSKAGLILRIIAGMYLIFSGGTLLRQMITLRPSDYILKSAIAIVFIVVGVWYGYRNIKATYYFVKGETEDQPTDKAIEEQEEVHFNKPAYDESKYRTAPMAVAEDSKKEMRAEDTDLRANMKNMSSDGTAPILFHEEATESDRKEVKREETKVEKKESPILDQKTVVLSDMPIHVEAGTKKAEVTNDADDPVKLAIEIMQDEDKERIEKEAEEFESDFEEK